MKETDRLLTAVEVAEWLSIQPHTLAQWRTTNKRNKGKPLPFIRVGRDIRYRWSDVNDWLNASRVDGTSND